MLVFGGQHFDVRHPRVIVDSDVGVLPADAVGPLGAVAVDAVSRSPDTGQFLRIQVQ